MSERARIFSLFSAAYFLSYFFRSANAVIAPDLSRELALSAADLGLMTSLFYAAFALVQLPLGIGLDRFGPRWITPTLMFVGALGSLTFASAHSFAVLALGRALIGVGMAGVLMGSLKAFSQWYPPDRFTTASGFLIGIGTLGSLVSATPLGWLSQTVGWRSVFAWGALAIAASGAAIMLWTRNTPPGVSWPHTARAEGGLGSVFSDLRFWRIALLAFFMAGTQLGTQGLWAGPYLYDVARLARIAAGNVLLLMAVGVTAGCTVSGWLATRLGVARVVSASALIFLLCQAVLILIPPTGLLRLVYLLFGLSGAFNVMLLAHVRFVFPPAMTGRAVTAVNVFGIGGTFLLQWWMGLIIGAFPADRLGHYPPQAYSAAFAFTAAGTLVALLWYLPLARGASQAYDAYRR